MISLFEIFKTFFIVGLQLIGGGYVIFPLLKKYLVEEKKLIKEDELIDYLALSQCLPGIIALNISIFSGYKLRKIKGATVAILGLLLPSFLIILLISGFIANFQNNEIMQNIFYGIRLSVIILIFYMIYDIFKKTPKNLFSIFLFIFVLSFGIFLKISPAVLVTASILIALLKEKIK